METIEEAFNRFMGEVYKSVPKTSIQWVESRKVFFCACAWLTGELSEAKGDVEKVMVMIQELKAFSAEEKRNHELYESILKAGGKDASND